MQQNVGRYRIVRPLGRGAMGLVYLAEDPSLNRQVAIKMLDISADSETDREFMHTRLLRDARAAAMLSHPNIVAVYDIVEIGSSVYVVMEYIDGESLASFLDHTPMPDPVFVLHVIQQVAAGLDYTHSKGIIHRDIKPGNVMIKPDKTVKILDFGIARMSDGRTSTPTGVVMGTIDYMAPEQVKALLVDGRADQFALAAVAYRMLTGSTLFGRHTLVTLAYKLLNEDPEPVGTRNAQIPAGVDQVLAKALSKSPEDRYPNCGAFARELGRKLTGSIDEPTAPLTTVMPVMSEPTEKTPAAGAIKVMASAGTGSTAFQQPSFQKESPRVDSAQNAAPRQENPRQEKKNSGMAAWLAGGALLAAGAGAVIWHPWDQTKPSSTPATATVTTPVATVKEPEKPPVEPPQVTTPPVEKTPEPVTKKTEAAKTPPVIKKTTVTKTSEKAEVVPPVLPPVTKTPEKPPEKVAVIPPVTPPETKTPPISTVPDTGVSERPTYESTPGDNGTPMRRGQEAMKVKDYGAAIQAFTQVIQNRPKFAEGYFDRGFAYEMSGHPDKAIQDYSDVIRMTPRHTRAWANRGICEARLHQDDAAIADFNRALELDPNYPGALNGHGAILMRRHDLKGAIRDFSAAIKSNPKFELAYENRAKAKKALKDDFGAADDLAVVQRLRQGK